MKHKIGKWQRWFGSITHDILIMQMSKQCNDDLATFDFSKQNNFYKFMQLWYSNYMVMGIRRQVKPQKDSISLFGLLSDMHDYPKAITRTQFVNRFGDKSEGNSIYDDFAGKNKKHLDNPRISIELIELKNVSAKCEQFADRLIAHLDRRGLPTSKWPSYAELNKALSYLEQLREKYARFFYSDKPNSIIKFKPPEMKHDITSFIKKAIR